MTFANILLRLWKLRIWVGAGAALAVVAAVGVMSTSHSKVFASATTQMLVDSPQSALPDAKTDLTGYLARADVFARLMTSSEALQYIGNAARIPGNLIQASGPVELNGNNATHAATTTNGAPVVPSYKLDFLQNPELPTIDIYAEAPTTTKAIALANGAVTGFNAFITHLEAGNSIADNKRIVIRALGSATGGVVDPGVSKKIALMAFVAVWGIWCSLLLFGTNLRRQLRAAKADGETGREIAAGPPLNRSVGPSRLPDARRLLGLRRPSRRPRRGRELPFKPHREAV